MKSFSSLLLGVLSSALLSIGLVRAAQVCDTHKSAPATVQAAHPANCCSTPCNYLQD